MQKQYKNVIKNNEEFNPVKFPFISEEIGIINEKCKPVPALFKAAIIISFLKNHSLLNEWIAANPQLVKLVTSGLLFTGAIEALFLDCRENLLFKNQFEAHLISSL